jgi:hypothetical protein
VNIHGSFVLAPVLLVLSALEDRPRSRELARRGFVVAASCVVVAFLNPFGARIWLYVTNLTTDPEIRNLIDEWQPTRPDSLTGVAFYVSVVAVAFAVLSRRPRPPWPRLIALAVVAALGVQAVRGVMWWALAAPVLIADLFPERRTRVDRPSLLNVAIAAVIVALMVPVLPWFRPLYAADATSFSATDGILLHAPATLSGEVRDGVEPGARMFVDHDWSSWFELEVPRNPVFVDPRIELFPAEVWDDYLTVISASEGWEEILERWEVDVVVLSDERRTLTSALEADAGWTPVYRDVHGSVFARADAAGVEVASG